MNIRKEKIIETVGKIDLINKTDTRSKNLSGGMKRKLCVGMALVGDPEVLFLDEPTAGLDPESRRKIWTMLQSEKGRKTIILCTHHMEEADLLGDRIVVMSHGKLQVAGSSMFLKSKFGIGYRLTIETKNSNAHQVERMKSIVQSIVKDAKLKIKAFNQENEITFELPMSTTHLFPDLLEILENEIAENGPNNIMVGFGLTMPSMEEVFLRLADIDKATTSDEGALKTARSGSFLTDHVRKSRSNSSLFSNEGKSDEEQLPSWKNVGSLTVQMKALIVKRMNVTKRNSVILKLMLTSPMIYLALCFGIVYLKKFVASSSSNVATEATVLTMEGLNYGNDAWIYSGYPSVLNVFSNGKVPTDSTLNGWEKSVTGLKFEAKSFHVHVDNCGGKVYTGPYKFGKCMLEKAPLASAPFANTMFAGIQYGKYENNLTLSYNTSFPAAPPILTNWVSSTILRNSITNANNDLHFAPSISNFKGKKDEEHNISALISVLFNLPVLVFICSAFGMVAGAASMFLVEEKNNYIRHQQRMAGVSTSAYLLSNYIFDYITMVPMYSVLVALYIYVGAEGALPISIPQLLLYGFSVLSFAYAVSTMFKDPKSSYTAIIQFSSLSYLLITVLLNIIQQTSKTSSIPTGIQPISLIEYALLLVSPATALGIGANRMQQTALICATLQQAFPTVLKECTTNTLKSLLEDPAKGRIAIQMGAKGWQSNGSWEVGGAMTFFFIVHALMFFWIKLYIDYNEVRASFKIGGTSNNNENTQIEMEDEDVRVERVRIDSFINGNAQTELKKDANHIACANLEKTYKIGGILNCSNEKKLAVDGVSFTVQKGTCFALLGPNGAGKTSTMSMLTGVTSLTNGEGYINSMKVTTSLNEAYKEMGFCPQFGGLFDFLSVREHLEFYCTVRGMPMSKKNQTITFLLDKLGLEEHNSKLSKELSGGNKRKLSMAIAMIGKPSVLLLDEPTAGVDPAIRRAVVEVIDQVKATSSIILTTHIMEEVEALSEIVGIMVNGKLSCYGSLQHLVNRFGTYFVMEIRSKKEENWEAIDNYVRSIFPTVLFVEKHFNQSTWRLPKSDIALSKAFRAIENKKKELEIENYAISQLSLEQLFLKFAKLQAEEEEEG